MTPAHLSDVTPITLPFVLTLATQVSLFSWPSWLLPLLGWPELGPLPGQPFPSLHFFPKENLVVLLLFPCLFSSVTEHSLNCFVYL